MQPLIASTIVTPRMSKKRRRKPCVFPENLRVFSFIVIAFMIVYFQCFQYSSQHHRRENHP